MMRIHLKPWILFCLMYLMATSSLAASSCFPVGMATHDRECYDFETSNECLEKTDIYSCGWGKRTENPVHDDDLLICESSRCPNNEDGDGDYDDEAE